MYIALMHHVTMVLLDSWIISCINNRKNFDILRFALLHVVIYHQLYYMKLVDSKSLVHLRSHCFSTKFQSFRKVRRMIEMRNNTTGTFANYFQITCIAIPSCKLIYGLILLPICWQDFLIYSFYSCILGINW